jgi:hypothetical protein
MKITNLVCGRFNVNFMMPAKESLKGTKKLSNLLYYNDGTFDYKFSGNQEKFLFCKSKTK